MVTEKKTNADHVAKQRKKKNLSNEMVYCSQKGIVDMHPLGKVELSMLDNKSVNVLFKNLLEGIKTLNKRLDTQKDINKKLVKRLDKIERKMKTNGIE